MSTKQFIKSDIKVQYYQQSIYILVLLTILCFVNILLNPGLKNLYLWSINHYEGTMQCLSDISISPMYIRFSTNNLCLFAVIIWSVWKNRKSIKNWYPPEIKINFHWLYCVPCTQSVWWHIGITLVILLCQRCLCRLLHTFLSDTFLRDHKSDQLESLHGSRPW